MNSMKLRRWAFTLNNPTESEIQRLKTYLTTDVCVYAIVGKEQGEQYTIHLQGFVHLKNNYYLTVLNYVLAPERSWYRCE